VLGLVVVLVVLAAVFGGGINERLTGGGFFDESSESRQADRALEEYFGAGPNNTAILFDPVDSFVSKTEPQLAALHRALEADPQVAALRSPIDLDTDELERWSLGNNHPMVGQRNKSAILTFTVLGDEDQVLEHVEHLQEQHGGVVDGVEHTFTNAGPVALQTREMAEADATRAELLTAPFTLVALLVVFGGLVAALLPLVIAVVAVLGTFLVLTLITGFSDVSVFARTLATSLGLGLGIDYSLFVVSRYREERAAGRNLEQAISRTLQTAGRTVAFSAATVAVSLAALFLFPVVYLRSFAWAGISVVLLAAAAAVVVLPTVLVVLGDRIDSLPVRRRKRQPLDADRFWSRQARRVLRRPIPYAVVVTAVLVIAALPFFGVSLSRIDDRVLPADASSRLAAEQIREQYPIWSTTDIIVTDFGLDDPDPARCYELTSEPCLALDAYARTLFELEGIAGVTTERGTYTPNPYVATAEFGFDGSVTSSAPLDVIRQASFIEPLAAPGATRIVLTFDRIEPISPEGEAVVGAIRDVDAPFDEVLVTGDSARLRDLNESVGARVPWALAWIAVSTIVVLILMLGAPLIPVKALVLNLLSLTATFGALVWIFQDGNLSGLLGFESSGSIDLFTPILMFCVAFGLSMDYEVFLLSRIKEEYDISGDNEHSVEVGLAKTGPIVTAAALLLALVFAAFATSEVLIPKMIGVGMVIAVLTDAFLIRATLVPAFMKLAGRANWWAPSWMRRWHLRWGMWEREPIELGD